LASSGNATARAAAARLVIDKLAAHGPLNAELARRAAYEAIQQQMQAQMPAVREKLTVLIERKAQALAREMYRKRMKLETEAIKAEMTTGASTESAGEDAPTQEREQEA
jgi:polyhydroxyalkanoate synthesis regulator phasin